MAAMLLALASVVVAVTGAEPALARQRAATPSVQPQAGQFHGKRVRVVDNTTIAAGATATVQVAGVGGLPSSGLASIWLNLASRAPTTAADGSGSLIVHPTGTATPAVTGGRYIRGKWSHDLLLVKVGSDGKILIKNSGPQATTVVVNGDVYGYTLNSPVTTAGSTYVGVTPARTVSNASIAAGATATFEVLGKGGVPASGVSHVVFTMIGDAPGDTKLVVHPSGSSVPANLTNLDLWDGNYRDNLVVAEVGADGKVAVSNVGSQTATIWMDLSGYYASPQAALAGAVTVPVQPARYGSAVSVPANGTHTLAPLGQNGVPGSGVTAIALNVTVRSSGTGHVRLYPSGTTRPGTWTVGYPDANIYNAGFIAAQLGSDGKVVLHNPGSVAVSVEFDVFAYFIASAGCTQVTSGAEAPAMSARQLDIEKNSRISVIQATPAPGETVRPLEYAFVDNIGRLVYVHQRSPDDFRNVWQGALPTFEAFTGTPGLAEQADGRLHIVTHNINGHMWAITQTSKEPPTWGSWVDFPQRMGTHPTLARHGDTLVTFVSDVDGLWALPQRDPNGPFGSWIKVGLNGLSGTPVAVEVPGGIQVFVKNHAGTWQTALYAGGLLSGCASLGGSGFGGAAAVVSYPDGRLRIVAWAGDGTVQTKVQGADGRFPAEWETVGTLTAKGTPTAVLTPENRVEIVVRGPDGKLYNTGETQPGSGEWRAWSEVQDPDDTYVAATDPKAFGYVDSDGAKWAFVTRDDNLRVRVHVPSAGGRTAAEKAEGGPVRFTTRTLPKPPAR